MCWGSPPGPGESSVGMEGGQVRDGKVREMGWGGQIRPGRERDQLHSISTLMQIQVDTLRLLELTEELTFVPLRRGSFQQPKFPHGNTA